MREAVAGRSFQSPFPPELKISPHGKATVTMERLVEFTPEGARYLFPTAPGDYSLTIYLRVLARKDGAAKMQPMTIKAGPIPLPIPPVKEKQ